MPSAVLVAEPEPETREYLGRQLRDDGFDVLGAARRSEALELAERARPDVVLLAELDLCLHLRRGEPGRTWDRNVPVILLAPSSDPVDRVRALERGADDVMGRPFAYDELLARIRALLRRSSVGAADVLAQTVSRAIALAQLTVLPSAYAAAVPDQRLGLITLWDVLRQLASVFGVISATANPTAVSLLCWAARTHPRFSPVLLWSGFGLAALTLFYSFFTPGAALAPLWLPLGLGLTFATFVWLIGLAATLWSLPPP